MNAQRVAVKLFVRPDPAEPVDLHALIPLFHRFIQEASVEGLLIDVADYIHVPEGPGVILIGHDVDYALDQTGGRAGLLTTRKRCEKLPLAEAVADALRLGLIAAQAVERAGSTGLRFGTDGIQIQIVDRLAANNDSEAAEAVEKVLAPLLAESFGGAKLSQSLDSGSLAPLTLLLSDAAAVEAETLIEKLGGRRPTLVPPDVIQGEWRVSAEDLAKLRDEGAALTLIDVRERDEFDICNLGGDLIPLGMLASKLSELDPSAHVVAYCKSGDRAAKATAMLREAGFENAWNLEGGILAWIDRIDPSLTPY